MRSLHWPVRQPVRLEDADGISPTEREFDRATDLGKKRLIFVKGNDDKARHPKMQALIDKASEQLNRRRFDSTAELTALVYASLVDCLVAAGTVLSKPFDAAACPEATLTEISRKKVTDFLELAQKQPRLCARTENADAEGTRPPEPA